MIISFKHKGLKLFFETGSTAGIQANHASKLAFQLATLNQAKSALDMNAPSWNLHQLQGNLAGHCSIKVSGNWRLTFKVQNGHAEVVDYQDYH